MTVRHTGVVKADIVVIGAGALGLSTALHCAMTGRSVVVVERATAGSQASSRAAGLFKSVQADELRTVLARRSIVRAIRFADWSGVSLDGQALADWITGAPQRLDVSALAPGRFGAMTDAVLLSGGVWQYAHFYGGADES